jgi:hypothetical protein
VTHPKGSRCTCVIGRNGSHLAAVAADHKATHASHCCTTIETCGAAASEIVVGTTERECVLAWYSLLPPSSAVDVALLLLVEPEAAVVAVDSSRHKAAALATANCTHVVLMSLRITVTGPACGRGGSVGGRALVVVVVVVALK